MNKILSIKEVLAIAQKVAESLNIEINDIDELAVKIVRRNALPQIYNNSIAKLWIDKYYVAYMYEDDDLVQYIYVTQYHIDEEMQSCTNTFKLPAEIDLQFAFARAEMLKTNKKYYIFNKTIVNHSKT
jgi:hypothetical protein